MPVTGRRKAREMALQILYQQDLVGGGDRVEKQPGTTSEEQIFADRLVSGVRGNLQEIDATIERVSKNWRVKRMPIIDRNIIRMGVFELCYCDDIPATVSINEMVEVAKHYGAEESASFVNGVLDKVKAEVNRPSKAP